MASGQGQVQTQVQQQRLSSQLVQAIGLLGLSTLMLEARVKREIEENPALDEDRSTEQAVKEVSVDTLVRETEEQSYGWRGSSSGMDFRPREVAASTSGWSMQETIVEQLGYRNLSPTDLQIAEFIIGSLDSDGYLRRDTLSLADDIAFSLYIDVSAKDVERVLDVIHHIEPGGIGARDVREALLLQLSLLPEQDDTTRLAYTVIERYFDDFAAHRFDRIAERMGITDEQLRAASEEIRSLNPRPGAIYADTTTEEAVYVTPDFIVTSHDDRIEMSLSAGNMPQLKVNRHYREMIQQAKENGKMDEATRFAKERVEAAEWFIESVCRRRETLVKVMRAIIERQKAYFLSGEETDLAPMTLRQVAEDIGMDISTVSRVVNSKYVQTPFGILLLRDLFTESIRTATGEEVSTQGIKQIIRTLINEEDKRNPLTDDMLTTMLTERGYVVARRTVAKYRESLGIATARGRRQL